MGNIKITLIFTKNTNESCKNTCLVCNFKGKIILLENNIIGAEGKFFPWNFPSKQTRSHAVWYIQQINGVKKIYLKKKKVKIIATYLICRKIKGTQHLLYIPLLKYGALQTEQSDPTCAEMGIQELPKKKTQTQNTNQIKDNMWKIKK